MDFVPKPEVEAAFEGWYKAKLRARRWPARPVEPPAKAGSARIPLSADLKAAHAAGMADLQLNRDGSTVHRVGQSFYPFVTNGDSESRARASRAPSPSAPAPAHASQ